MNMEVLSFSRPTLLLWKFLKAKIKLAVCNYETKAYTGGIPHAAICPWLTQ